MRWPWTRVAVAGVSMVPALAPGDWVVVRRSAPVRPGDIVVVRRPGQPGLLVVKRVTRAAGDGRWWVEGDNAAASDDSRVFGAVGTGDIVGRVVLRYWPWRAIGRVR